MDKSFNKEKLGKRIKEIRISKNLSQNALCDLIDMDPSMLSNFETGKTLPTIPTLFKIMSALNVEPNSIFNISHIKNEKELKNDLITKYDKLSPEKKMFLYRLIELVEELV